MRNEVALGCVRSHRRSRGIRALYLRAMKGRCAPSSEAVRANVRGAGNDRKAIVAKGRPRVAGQEFSEWVSMRSGEIMDADSQIGASAEANHAAALRVAGGCRHGGRPPPTPVAASVPGLPSCACWLAMVSLLLTLFLLPRACPQAEAQRILSPGRSSGAIGPGRRQSFADATARCRLLISQGRHREAAAPAEEALSRHMDAGENAPVDLATLIGLDELLSCCSLPAARERIATQWYDLFVTDGHARSAMSSAHYAACSRRLADVGRVDAAADVAAEAWQVLQGRDDGCPRGNRRMGVD